MVTPPFAGAQDLTLLTTKLYIPPPSPNLVLRPHLIQRLEDGLRLGHRLILISADVPITRLTATVVEQAALYDLLRRLHTLHVPLLSLAKVE
jgi:hypothetical protein